MPIETEWAQRAQQAQRAQVPLLHLVGENGLPIMVIFTQNYYLSISALQK
jgi:hypothetical protein